uniref:Uncharacterized protein n=1 Tax=Hucho hucho TaxID=62062 RepID=A0A4W5LLW6_9TELE
FSLYYREKSDILFNVHMIWLLAAQVTVSQLNLVSHSVVAYHPLSLQLHGPAQKQQQLPGDLHDQCRPLLYSSAHLLGYGDVPGGPAAVPPRLQGL